jgi:hypothetical protein
VAAVVQVHRVVVLAAQVAAVQVVTHQIMSAVMELLTQAQVAAVHPMPMVETVAAELWLFATRIPLQI